MNKCFFLVVLVITLAIVHAAVAKSGTAQSSSDGLPFWLDLPKVEHHVRRAATDCNLTTCGDGPVEQYFYALDCQGFSEFYSFGYDTCQLDTLDNTSTLSATWEEYNAVGDWRYSGSAEACPLDRRFQYDGFVKGVCINSYSSNGQNSSSIWWPNITEAIQGGEVANGSLGIDFTRPNVQMLSSPCPESDPFCNLTAHRELYGSDSTCSGNSTLAPFYITNVTMGECYFLQTPSDLGNIRLSCTENFLVGMVSAGCADDAVKLLLSIIDTTVCYYDSQFAQYARTRCTVPVPPTIPTAPATGPSEQPDSPVAIPTAPGTPTASPTSPDTTPTSSPTPRSAPTGQATGLNMISSFFLILVSGLLTFIFA